MTEEEQKHSIQQLHKGWHDPKRRKQLVKERQEWANTEVNKQRVSKMFKDKWANDESFQEKMRVKNIKHSDFMKQYNKDHPEYGEQIAAKRRRRIKVLETFTSPRNGALIEENTIFNSVTELCKAIGYETTDSVRGFSGTVLNNKNHPGVWSTNTINGKCYGSKRFHITTFEYLD